MDIRNFFGQRKTPEVKSEEKTVDKVHSPVNNINKRKRIIEDDDSDQVDTSVVGGLQSESVSSSTVASQDKSNCDAIPSTSSESNCTYAPSASTSASTSVPESASVPSTSSASFVLSAPPKVIADMITWAAGSSVPYGVVVDTFDSISRVSGRLDKENLFEKLFRAVVCSTPKDLDSIVYLASNCVSPAYDGLELGIGDSLLVKAICEATGRKKDAVEEAYEKEGDLGTVALLSRTSQKTLSFIAKPQPLTAVQVLDTLRAITQIKGDKAQGRKVDKIKSVLVRCQGNEAKYVIRALQGKLRIGTAAQTVLVSLAHAFARLPQSDESNGAGVSEDEISQTDTIADPFLHVSDFNSYFELISEREPPEARRLRVGVTDKETRKDLAEIAVKRAFSECPNLSLVTDALLRNPVHSLHRACRLIPGVPVHPMLAKPTKQITEVLRRLSGLAFTMEYKYDGERAQIHLLDDGTVKIFSRNSEDNTTKYRDLMDIIRTAKVPDVRSCVVDAEVVAYDREKNCLLPFQVLSTRKRKVEDGEEDNQKVKVVIQVFDMLYVNGKSLLSQSLRVRRNMLKASFVECEGFFYFAKGADHVEDGDTTPIETFMQEACAAMCEGLMVKTLDSNATYEPSKRSLNWLKLKKDYIDGMGICDSVDLVVIGGYRGKGKRVNVYGAYLMACYDPERDEFQSVCKVGTGFKDEDLMQFTELMKPLVLSTKKRPINYNVGDPLEPDDWFQASIVWEIQAADLSKSSVHRGGVGKLGDPGRGVGLRFPRYLRQREDKKAEGATSADQIADLYFSQGEGCADASAAAADEDDEDFI